MHLVPMFNVHVNCYCCTWACVSLKSSTCLSGWWLCVSLGWRNTSPLLMFRGFVCDSREYFGGRGTARCPLLHSFRENFSDVAASATSLCTSEEKGLHTAFLFTTSACTSEEEGKAFFLTKSASVPHNVGLYFGGGGTGLLPRNVGEYTQLVLRCVLSMSASRGVPALRMRLCWGTTQALVRWSPRRTWKRTLQVQVGVKESRSGPGFILHVDDL